MRLVEDTTGKGHVTKLSGSSPRNALFWPIDNRPSSFALSGKGATVHLKGGYPAPPG